MTRLRRIFLIFCVIFFSTTTHSIVAMEFFKAPFSKENPYNLVENVQKIVIINKENRALTDEQITKITKTIITAVDKNSNARRFVYYPETFSALLDLFEDYCIDQSSLRRLSNYLKKIMTAVYGNLIYTPITRDHVLDFCDDLLALANKSGSCRECPGAPRNDIVNELMNKYKGEYISGESTRNISCELRSRCSGLARGNDGYEICDALLNLSTSLGYQPKLH